VHFCARDSVFNLLGFFFCNCNAVEPQHGPRQSHS
jgi:hypothetical protein